MKKLSNNSKVCIALTLAMSILIGTGCEKKDTKESEKPTEVITETTERPSSPSETTEGSSTEGSSEVTVSETEPSEEPSTETTAENTPAPLKSVKLPEETFTRLSSDPITEYVPSSDYGKVYPFLGNTQVAGEQNPLYGFFDQNNRIVCDPIFNYISPCGDTGYIVTDYSGPSPMTGGTCGYVSADGSYFSGIKYDWISNRNGIICFMNISDEVVKCANFDPMTNSFTESFELKTFKNENSYGDFCYVVDNRYLLYGDDYGFLTYAVDGKTGEVITTYGKNENRYDGNLIVSSSMGGTDSDIAVYTVQGELLYESGKYTYYVFHSECPDRFIFARKDGFDITDADGKIVNSLENKDGEILYMDYTDNYFIAKTQNEIRCYDKDMTLVNTTKTALASEFFPVEKDYSWKNAEKTSLKPLLYYRYDEEITFLEPITGKTTTVKNSGKNGIPTRLPGRILLTELYLDDHSWKLLNASDYCVLAEGTGTNQVIYDSTSDKYYLLAHEGLNSGPSKIIDMQTGKVFMDSLVNPEDLDIKSVRIMGYQILYTVAPNPYDDNRTQVHPATILADKEGKILFLHFAENGYTA